MNFRFFLLAALVLPFSLTAKDVASAIRPGEVWPDSAGKPGRFIFMADRWNKDDLAASRYIWLPIGFNADGHPEVQWLSQWRPR